MDPLRRDFQNPPASHRAAPLWVWNDLMSENQIETQLKELKSHGFGGAFVHPRPGMITDYLSEEWFDRWGFALRTAKALGMKLYIYDENSYPSGFAGGYVSAMLPDCLAEGMTYRVCDLRNDPLPGEPPVAAFACAQKGETLEIGEDLSVYPPAQWARHARKAFVVLPVRAAAAGWTCAACWTTAARSGSSSTIPSPNLTEPSRFPARQPANTGWTPARCAAWPSPRRRAGCASR